MEVCATSNEPFTRSSLLRYEPAVLAASPIGRTSQVEPLQRKHALWFMPKEGLHLCRRTDRCRIRPFGRYRLRRERGRVAYRVWKGSRILSGSHTLVQGMLGNAL